MGHPWKNQRRQDQAAMRASKKRVQDERAAERAAIIALQKDRAEHRQALCTIVPLFAIFVFGVPAAGILFEKHLTQPISEDGIVVRNTGRVFTSNSTCITDYDFEKRISIKRCYFPRGAFSVTTALSAMDAFDVARYGRVQEKACALAAGRSGYSIACSGLRVSNVDGYAAVRG